ncbi:MAG: ribosome assembly RNA-binding protein YhbY [Gammaproteobacteria bacterium]|nr:ribosome assembly RNA-binding protein YhbY [Gammaproteobacteria bacterium]
MLTGKERRHLNGLAHTLKPVVTLGNAGLTDNVINEINIALNVHELIKVKINHGDRDIRKQVDTEIAERAQCDPVKNIGRVFIYYRPAKKPTIKLPAA